MIIDHHHNSLSNSNSDAYTLLSGPSLASKPLQEHKLITMMELHHCWLSSTLLFIFQIKIYNCKIDTSHTKMELLEPSGKVWYRPWRWPCWHWWWWCWSNIHLLSNVSFWAGGLSRASGLRRRSRDSPKMQYRARSIQPPIHTSHTKYQYNTYIQPCILHITSTKYQYKQRLFNVLQTTNRHY